MNVALARSPNIAADSAAKAWLRALETTAPIAQHPQRILPTVIEEVASQFGGLSFMVWIRSET